MLYENPLHVFFAVHTLALFSTLVTGGAEAGGNARESLSLKPYSECNFHGVCAPAKRPSGLAGRPGLAGMDGTSAVDNSLSQIFLGVSQNFDL